MIAFITTDDVSSLKDEYRVINYWTSGKLSVITMATREDAAFDLPVSWFIRVTCVPGTGCGRFERDFQMFRLHVFLSPDGVPVKIIRTYKTSFTLTMLFSLFILNRSFYVSVLTLFSSGERKKCFCRIRDVFFHMKRRVYASWLFSMKLPTPPGDPQWPRVPVTLLWSLRQQAATEVIGLWKARWNTFIFLSPLGQVVWPSSSLERISFKRIENAPEFFFSQSILHDVITNPVRDY